MPTGKMPTKQSPQEKGPQGKITTRKNHHREKCPQGKMPTGKNAHKEKCSHVYNSFKMVTGMSAFVKNIAKTEGNITKTSYLNKNA